MTSHPSEPQDEADVALAASGDARAFERLYLRHEDAIRRMFVALGRDPMQAEDLTQETFVMAWRKLGMVRHAAGFGRWLRRVGRNVLYDRLRAGRRDAMARGETVASDAALPARADALVERLDIDRCIAALPEHYRRAFVLFHVQGYAHRDIAGMLGIPVNTSKIRVHRATLVLRRALVA